MAGLNTGGVDQSRRSFLKSGSATLITTLVGSGVATQLAACGGGTGTNRTPSAPNTPPVPTTTTLSTDINQVAHFTLGATDVNNDLLTFAIATQPTHGTVTTTSAGVATYTPSTGYVGTDTFVYTVKDPTNTAVSQTVSVTINKLAAPSAPTLTADDFNHLVFPTGKTAADYEVSINSGASWSPAVATAYAAGTYQIRLIETATTSAGVPQTLTIMVSATSITYTGYTDAANISLPQLNILLGATIASWQVIVDMTTANITGSTLSQNGTGLPPTTLNTIKLNNQFLEAQGCKGTVKLSYVDTAGVTHTLRLMDINAS